jgi:DNA-binding transcriptional LysR family regulator
MRVGQLPHLETFAQAAELNSFTAAAKVLGLTQAAVSQRVQALEQALGVSLFDRQGGRILLTKAGQRLYGYVERILALHQEARIALGGQKTPLAGELSLAASSVPGERLLPPLLSAFRKKHPHIKVRATVTDTQVVLRQVEQGQAHLGLVGGKTDNPHLEFRCVGGDELALIVPGGHALARRRRLPFGQLARHPLIVREPGSGSRWCLEQALARAGNSVADLRVVLELGSNESIKEAVLQGLGLAILSRRAVGKEIKSGRLHGLQVTGLSLMREIFAVWDKRRVLPIPARLFLDLLERNHGARRPS